MALSLVAAAGEKTHCAKQAGDCAKGMYEKLANAGWLGIETDKSDKGVVTVKAVVPGSPAVAAGFQPGDVLVAINSADISDKAAVMAAKKSLVAGGDGRYTVLRRGAFTGGFMATTNPAPVEPVDMKLEVVLLKRHRRRSREGVLPESGLAGRHRRGEDGFRGVQITPHNSEASIIFGKGITTAKPGSAHSLVLAVDDIDATRSGLIARGVDVSEVFHYAGGPFNSAVENPCVGGRDPQDRSYFSFASFEDPDGNGWLLQEMQTRLPGREWKSPRARAADVPTLAELRDGKARTAGRTSRRGNPCSRDRSSS